MESTLHCPECGAPWTDGVTCQEHFSQMGFWEMENPGVNYAVHHLMVLSYHLQHPSLYSPEGLSGARGLLVDFLEGGISPQQVRARNRDKLDSGRRKYKITGAPDSHGSYDHPVAWTMTAADVIARGESHYVESVNAWAHSILAALKTSENL